MSEEAKTIAGLLFRAMDDLNEGREPLHDFDVVLESPEYKEKWLALGAKAVELGARLPGAQDVDRSVRYEPPKWARQYFHEIGARLPGAQDVDRSAHVELRLNWDQLCQVAETLIGRPDATPEDLLMMIANIATLPRFGEPVDVCVSKRDEPPKWARQHVQKVWTFLPSEKLVGFTTNENWNCHASEERERWKRVEPVAQGTDVDAPDRMFYGEMPTDPKACTNPWAGVPCTQKDCPEHGTRSPGISDLALRTAKVLEKLSAVADAYDENALDEIRPARGYGLTHDLTVDLLTGRGGRPLLRLGDFLEAREIVRALSTSGAKS